jgi:isopenicillin-N N-acyltransferase-like protein
MGRIRLLDVAGTPYQMGQQHGQTYAKAIRDLTTERLHLSFDSLWTGRALSRERVLALAEACLEAHRAYAPDLMEELEGLARATDLGLPELIIASGFTDFVDTLYNAEGAGQAEPVAAARGNECTTFLTTDAPTEAGYGLLGQTWDMHESAMPHVILLRGRPKGAPAFLTFTLTGCVGMIGMNEAGISVGINNLMGADGAPGVTWPFVIRKILAQTTLDDALRCITEARLAGAHNYLLLDADGRGYNVEAMSTACAVIPIDPYDETFAHANRCLTPEAQAVERPQTEDLALDSDIRLGRAQRMLAERPLSPEALMAITRDRSDGEYSICAVSEPPWYSATCGAAIMRPATREFWGVWGLPHENPYERFTL